MKLTKTTIAKLGPPTSKAETTYYDDELRGFGLRLRAGGKGSWVAVYRVGPKTRRVTIGDATIVAPEAARAKAKEILARADLGQDVQALRLEERAKAAVTFGSVVEMYVDEHVERRQRPRTQVETKRHLRVDCRPLHLLPIHQIHRRDLAGHLSLLAKTNGPFAANRIRAALSALFGWAMRQGIVEQNPVVGTGKHGMERPRDRFLCEEEIRRIWQATEGASDYNSIVRLLMLTGQRREEVAAISWNEIDFEKGVWSLPANRTKNGRAHDVPLSDQTLVTLAGISKTDGRGLMFGRGTGPFSGWSKCKERLDLRASVNDWWLHDLRRTVVTGMAEIGIQPHVIEAVVNHVSGHKAGVAGVYNRASYATEKRIALQRWANHLDDVVGSANE